MHRGAAAPVVAGMDDKYGYSKLYSDPHVQQWARLRRDAFEMRKAEDERIALREAARRAQDSSPESQYDAGPKHTREKAARETRRWAQIVSSSPESVRAMQTTSDRIKIEHEARRNFLAAGGPEVLGERVYGGGCEGSSCRAH